MRRPDSTRDRREQVLRKGSLRVGAVAQEERPCDAKEHESREQQRDADRHLQHGRAIVEPHGHGSGKERADREATGVEAERRDHVRPLARPETRDRAEDACSIDVGADAEQDAARYRVGIDRVTGRHRRKPIEDLRDQEPAGDPQRRLDHADEALSPPPAHEFVDRRDRARRAALDREAHQARANRGDEERGARQQDRHGSVRGNRSETARREDVRDMRCARPVVTAGKPHMCCIIVPGFLSLTMSAIVSTTVVLPSFFHQCSVPRNSREMSPALCRIGTRHLLLFS